MKVMPIRELIDKLRTRPDLGIADESSAWRIVITKGRDYVCEVTVPHDVLEWFACVKRRGQPEDAWSDWMDYSSYDDTPVQNLEAEMAQHILAFVNRVSINELRLPLQIYENKA